jgi:hypothetical protein
VNDHPKSVGRTIESPMELTINGSPQTLPSDELLIEVINRGNAKIPQVCYHPQPGPNQRQLHNHGAFELLRGALSAGSTKSKSKLLRSCD